MSDHNLDVNDVPKPVSKHVSGRSFKDAAWADRYFWIAAAIVILPQLSVPTRWLLWPLSQFATYVHELFHGLFALASGGAFGSMVMYPDGGGTAYTAHYTDIGSAISSAGGLLGPAIVGAIILFFSRRFKMTHNLLLVMGILIAISIVFWARDAYTVWFCIIASSILIGSYFIPSKTVVRIFAQVIGIQLCLQNLLDFRYMFIESFERNGETLYSDTGNIAQSLGGTFWVWATLIAGLTLGIVVLALWKSAPEES